MSESPFEVPLPEKENWQRANILVIGDSGTGKTELINTVFGVQVGKTGKGQPVTQHIKYYLANDETVGIYDSRGFEFGDGEQKIRDFVDHEISELWDKDALERIHLAWIVLSPRRRFGDLEILLVDHLHSLGVKVFLVATHIGSKNGEWLPEDLSWFRQLKASDIARKVGTRNIFATNAIVEPRTPTVFGHMELVECTIDAAPESVREAIIVGQRVNLERKRALAQKVRDKYVSYGSTAAGLAGIVPFADSAVVYGALQECTKEIAGIYKVAPELQNQIAKAVASYTLIGTSVAESGKAVGTKVGEKVGKKVGEKIGGEVLGKGASKVLGPLVSMTVAAASAAATFTLTSNRLITALESEDIGHFQVVDEFMELFRAVSSQKSKDK